MRPNNNGGIWCAIESKSGTDKAQPHQIKMMVLLERFGLNCFVMRPTGLYRLKRGKLVKTAFESVGLSGDQFIATALDPNVRRRKWLLQPATIDRADRISAMIKANVSLGEIGRQFGISRQRVHQIVQRLARENRKGPPTQWPLYAPE